MENENIMPAPETAEPITETKEPVTKPEEPKTPSGAEKFSKIGIPEVSAYIAEKCKDPEYEKLVLQKSKTWDKCYDFMRDKAEKIKKGNMAVVPDHVGFDWIDEYFRKDDAAEEAVEAEEKKKRDAVRKKCEQEEKDRAKKSKERQQKYEEKKASGQLKWQQKKPEPPKKEPVVKVPEKPKNTVDGQMSLFDMM